MLIPSQANLLSTVMDALVASLRLGPDPAAIASLAGSYSRKCPPLKPSLEQARPFAAIELACRHLSATVERGALVKQACVSAKAYSSVLRVMTGAIGATSAVADGRQRGENVSVIIDRRAGAGNASSVNRAFDASTVRDLLPSMIAEKLDVRSMCSHFGCEPAFCMPFIAEVCMSQNHDSIHVQAAAFYVAANALRLRHKQTAEKTGKISMKEVADYAGVGGEVLKRCIADVEGAFKERIAELRKEARSTRPLSKGTALSNREACSANQSEMAKAEVSERRAEIDAERDRLFAFLRTQCGIGHNSMVMKMPV